MPRPPQHVGRVEGWRVRADLRGHTADAFVAYASFDRNDGDHVAN